MAILGHGIDLVETARIGRMIADHGQHFLDRCFTQAEQAYCGGHKRATEHYAGRFAAKEAILKVLGTGWRGQIAWTDMEILNDPAGKPVLRLTAESARLAAELGIVKWHLSISHTAGHAMASAIGESAGDK
jgi:holo-[acyl-carrier protein] synthase